MAIQHMDNFSMYGVGGQARMTNGVWASIGNFSSCDLVDDPDPNVTHPVLQLRGGAGWDSSCRFVYTSAQNIAGSACRFYVNRIPANTSEKPKIISFRSAANIELAYVSLNQVGGIEVYINNVLAGTTTGPVLTANAWWHIESKINTGATTAVEVRVEGLPVITVEGTSTASCAQVALNNDRPGASNDFFAYWKDVVFWDGSGDNNNNFLGSVVVTSLIPNSDELTGWTPSTGTQHYPLVDNAPPQDATQFVTAPFPPPGPDRYGLTGLVEDVTSVRALMTMVRARKTDGGDGNLQVSLETGTATAAGANRAITAAFTYWRDIQPKDPDTNAPWLPEKVTDSVSLKLDRTL